MNRPAVKDLTGEALREIPSAAIGRDQMAKRVEPAVDIAKKWIERAKKIQAKMMRKMMKSEDIVFDVDVVASLTEKLNNAEKELAKERLVSQQSIQNYQTARCVICNKRMTAS